MRDRKVLRFTMAAMTTSVSEGFYPNHQHLSLYTKKPMTRSQTGVTRDKLLSNLGIYPQISKHAVFLIHIETSEQPYLHQHHDTGTQKVTSGRILTNNLHLTGQAVWLYSSWCFSIGQATEIIRQTALRGGKNTGLVYYHHAKSFHRIWVIIISH